MLTFETLSTPLQPAQMSFLGVGAPEAILVGIVALVVFGPKGLAEVWVSEGEGVITLRFLRIRAEWATLTRCLFAVPLTTCTSQAAKSLGQTLRAFQPTIKEVVGVGQELKGSLEKVCATTTTNIFDEDGRDFLSGV